MAFVSHLVLIGDDHPNDGGLAPFLLIEVWQNNRIVFICKQIRSIGNESPDQLINFRKECKDPATISVDLVAAVKKALALARKNKVPSANIAIISFTGGNLIDNAFLRDFEKACPKRNIYNFKISDSITYNRWANSWDRHGLFVDHKDLDT